MNILGLGTFVTTIQLCCGTAKVAIDNMYTNGHNHVSIKFYLQNQTSGGGGGGVLDLSLWLQLVHP